MKIESRQSRIDLYLDEGEALKHCRLAVGKCVFLSSMEACGFPFRCVRKNAVLSVSAKSFIANGLAPKGALGDWPECAWETVARRPKRGK